MTIFELHLFGMTLAPTYYGLAYALGMIGAYAWIARRGIFSRADLDVLLYAVMVGILVGGRLGYVFFYNFSYYLQHPLQVFAFHEGGMSFHGGIIGVVLGLLWFAHSRKISLLTVSDEVAVTVPLGITLGRAANYLNNELYGFAGYTGPFAMVRNGISHFPSPLLEAVMEGIILWGILLWLQSRRPKIGLLSGVFLLGYGLARIMIEAFFRLPDVQLWYFWGIFTLGQILSVPICIGWAVLVYRARSKTC